MTREHLQTHGYRRWPDALRQDSILWQKRIADEGEHDRAYLNIHEATSFHDAAMRRFYTWDADLYIERPDRIAMHIQWYCLPTDSFDAAMLTMLETEAVELWRRFHKKATT
jgi:hypothetical protein